MKVYYCAGGSDLYFIFSWTMINSFNSYLFLEHLKVLLEKGGAKICHWLQIGGKKISWNWFIPVFSRNRNTKSISRFFFCLWFVNSNWFWHTLFVTLPRIKYISRSLIENFEILQAAAGLTMQKAANFFLLMAFFGL